MKVFSRLSLAVVALLIASVVASTTQPVTAAPLPQGPRTEAVVKSLYAAYDINGPAVTIGGVPFQAGTTPGFTAGPNSQCVANPTILPPTTAEMTEMLRCFSWGDDQAPGFVRLAGVPNGVYEISLWSWEDSIASYFDVTIEGTVYTIYTTVPNQWTLLGPFRVQVVDGTLNVSTLGAAGNLAGIRVDRLVETADPGTAPQTRFEPVTPSRIFDTRPTSRVNHLGAKPATDSTTTVQITGQGGVPATGVVAVAVNVTATEAGGAGFVTAFPAGSGRPLASNLNTQVAGDTVPNMAIVALGAGGAISLYTNSSAHLIVDVAGYFTNSITSSAGRYFPVDPQRVLDTRPSSLIGYAGAKPTAGAVVSVPIRGRVGVPANASAVAITLTGTEADGAGFVTAFPSGIAIPTVSNLNLAGQGSTIANMAIVPIGADGSINLFTQRGTHLLVDVQGWFGDNTVPAGTAGYFVIQPPTRTADSRSATRVGLAPGPLAQLTVVQPSLGQTPAATPVSAVLFNLTATEVVAAGFVSAFPAGGTLPTVSNLNVGGPGQTVAVLSMTKTNAAGSISLLTQSGGELIVDVTGWITA